MFLPVPALASLSLLSPAWLSWWPAPPAQTPAPPAPTTYPGVSLPGDPPYNASIRPLVLWHGLGDSHASPGMLEFAELLRAKHPGIFVHSVYLDDALDKDRQAGFYGNVNEQIAFAAAQLAALPELAVPGGFDAIGFSQGGQFLRAYHERHAAALPPIHNLLTFGSQHMGVSDLPGCARGDWLCQVARRAAKGAVYGRWAQENIVQAQYYRDPANLETYLDVNTFLADINNEHPAARNATYKQNLAALNALVMVIFEQDETVVPKETAWFGSEAPPTEDLDTNTHPYPPYPHAYPPYTRSTAPKEIVPLRAHPLYTEDWIGLRALDERGGIVSAACPGVHMELTGCWEGVVEGWIGGVVGED